MLGRGMAARTPRLYVLPASHPCAAVMVALELKEIAYDRIDFLPLSQLLLGTLLYRGTTVPALRLDDERIVGSRQIMRRLDALVPDPALLPAPGDPAYARVLEAERWGDDIFQSVVRRLLVAALARSPSSMMSYAGDAKLPLPIPVLRPTLPLATRLIVKQRRADDQTVSADLAALPRQLERIDAWIADGLLGGEQPNAADLQIGSSIRLLQTINDVRPLIEGPPARPSAQLTRYFPPIAGEIPAGVLPAEWLPAPAGVSGSHQH
jgi:glutathione S-transferase